MMKSGMARVVFSVATAAVLVIGLSGCKSKKGMTGFDPNAGNLTPLDMPDGGYTQGLRGEFGEAITDADAQFENVSFAYDSFTVADSERRKIEAVADYLVKHTETVVVVDGHCDERGSREYNLSLGEHRALAVRAYLISLGVAGDRINTRSFGQEQPLDLGHDDAAWLKNRRGEFSLFKK